MKKNAPEVAFDPERPKCPRQDSNLRMTRFRKPPLYPPELRGRRYFRFARPGSDPGPEPTNIAQVDQNFKVWAGPFHQHCTWPRAAHVPLLLDAWA